MFASQIKTLNLMGNAITDETICQIATCISIIDELETGLAKFTFEGFKTLMSEVQRLTRPVFDWILKHRIAPAVFEFSCESKWMAHFSHF